MEGKGLVLVVVVPVKQFPRLLHSMLTEGDARLTFLKELVSPDAQQDHSVPVAGKRPVMLLKRKSCPSPGTCVNVCSLSLASGIQTDSQLHSFDHRMPLF